MTRGGGVLENLNKNTDILADFKLNGIQSPQNVYP